MDRKAVGWVINTAKRNYWRVCEIYDFEDLVQDGFLKYAYVKDRYPDAEDKKHLMALFKTTYLNYIHNLARKQRSVRANHTNECEFDLPLELLSTPKYHTPDTSPSIALLPPECRELLKALKNDPRARARVRKRLDRTRRTTNELFCRLIGADPQSVNIHRIITDALAS